MKVLPFKNAFIAGRNFAHVGISSDLGSCDNIKIVKKIKIEKIQMRRR